MMRLLVLSAFAFLVVFCIDHPKGGKVPTSLTQGFGLFVAIVVLGVEAFRGWAGSAFDVVAANEGIR